MIIKNKQLRALIEEGIERDEHGEVREITEHDLDDSIYNPANDTYIAMKKHLQGRMSGIGRTLRPSHLAIVKLANSGMKTAEVAEQTRVHPQTVLKVLKDPIVIELRDLMHRYECLIQGVTTAMKSAMLYRIAVRNELMDPKVSISAIAELNKTEHNEKVLQANERTGGTGNQTVIVQIADPRLKASDLDEAPRHLLRDIN